MTDVATKPKTDDPLGPQHRCRDFDEDCKDVPGPHPNGGMRTHLGCWLDDPTQGWCPFLRGGRHD